MHLWIFFSIPHEPKWVFWRAGWKRNYGCKRQIRHFQMTGEPGAKQTHYLLLVFLQAKMLRSGRCPKSSCDNPCGRGRISVIKTLLFTQCTDCFSSVFETESLGGGKEIKRLIWLFFCLALNQPASKSFSCEMKTFDVHIVYQVVRRTKQNSEGRHWCRNRFPSTSQMLKRIQSRDAEQPKNM